MLCEELEGWEGGARGDVCILWLIHIVVWQKSTQNCKAIILQITEEKKSILRPSNPTPVFTEKK